MKLNSLVVSLSREPWTRTNTARNSARRSRSSTSIRNRNFHDSARDFCECPILGFMDSRDSPRFSRYEPRCAISQVEHGPSFSLSRVIEKYAPAATILSIWIIPASRNYRKWEIPRNVGKLFNLTFSKMTFITIVTRIRWLRGMIRNCYLLESCELLNRFMPLMHQRDSIIHFYINMFNSREDKQFLSYSYTILFTKIIRKEKFNFL